MLCRWESVSTVSRKSPVDLPDLVGDSLNGRSVGNIPLDDLQSGPGVILKPCLADFAGPEGDGLLAGSPHERLRNGLLTDDINAGGEVLHQGAPIRSGGDGGAEGASDALDRIDGVFHGRAIDSRGLDDLDAGQLLVSNGDGVLLIAVGNADVDAVGRRVQGIARRGLLLYKGPQALGDIVDLDVSPLRRSHRCQRFGRPGRCYRRPRPGPCRYRR